MKRYFISILLLLSILLSCTSRRENANANNTLSTESTLKYAQGFTITTIGQSKLIEVTRPFPGAQTSFKYLLVNKGDAVPEHDNNTKVIYVPIARLVCTSTTHIPLLDYLNESEALVGFPSTDYISSENTRALIEKGNVTELGIDKGIDIERLALLKPDITMAYTMSGDFGQFKKIEELGIPVVINAEYLEEHPLGRAEWIKFAAAFFNKEELADSVFSAIERAYLSTREMAAKVNIKPTVMSGVVYGDTWFLPGGKNFAAQLIADAGGKYLWAENSSNSFLELSFESVYEKANQADFWIGVASFKSLSEIEAADKRYTKFKPFQTGRVYTYDARKGAKGGSEFLELGYLRPDIILQDLVTIMHPDLLPDHSLYFHSLLQ